MQLTVLHVNHQLRGFDSQLDEEFVRELAGRLGWPVHIQQGPPASGNLEAEARRVRQQYFAWARSEFELHHIALGHTASDQAETVLFRLLRGSGLSGLSGMAPVSRSGLVRPLLTTSREEVRRFAREHSIAWREDASNADLRFRRNRLRAQVLPDLAVHFNPRLEAVLTGTADLARTEESYWARKTEMLFRKLYLGRGPGGGIMLGTTGLARLHRAVRRRVLRHAVREVRGDLCSIDFAHIETILRIAESSGGHDRVQIPGVDAIRSFSTLLLTRPEALRAGRDYSIPITSGAICELPFAAGQISVNPVTSECPNCVTVKGEGIYFAEAAELDGDALDAASRGAPLHVRNWQPGDRFQRAGEPHPEKLKALFQECRVVLWDRRHWPVLVAGDEIAWTRRFGVAAKFAATAESRRRVLVRYSPAESASQD